MINDTPQPDHRQDHDRQFWGMAKTAALIVVIVGVVYLYQALFPQAAQPPTQP